MSKSTGSLNLFAGPNADYDTLASIYPILVDYDLKTVEPIPGFATSWERSTDGLTWTFRTRPNVTWSDGEPLTARDAAFTFNTIIKYQEGPTANYADFVKEVAGVTAPDDNTLVVTMKTPVSTLISNTATVVYILPEHVWGPFATGDGMGLKSFTNEPAQGRPVVSGGPFMLTENLPDRFRRSEHEAVPARRPPPTFSAVSPPAGNQPPFLTPLHHGHGSTRSHATNTGPPGAGSRPSPHSAHSHTP